MSPPDPTTILMLLGLGKYAASIISLLGLLGYIITWIAPTLNRPSDNANAFVKWLYVVVQKIAANLGRSTNYQDHPVVLAAQAAAQKPVPEGTPTP